MVETEQCGARRSFADARSASRSPFQWGSSRGENKDQHPAPRSAFAAAAVFRMVRVSRIENRLRHVFADGCTTPLGPGRDHTTCAGRLNKSSRPDADKNTDPAGSQHLRRGPTCRDQRSIYACDPDPAETPPVCVGRGAHAGRIDKRPPAEARSCPRPSPRSLRRTPVADQDCPSPSIGQERGPKAERLWLNDGSCVRRGPEHRTHVWSYDVVQCRAADGTALKTIGEHTRDCSVIRVDRTLTSAKVTDALSDVFLLRGLPSFLTPVQTSLPRLCSPGSRVSARQRYRPGQPIPCESFNARFRDESLARDIVYRLRDTQILIEWRTHSTTKSPHRALGHQPRTPPSRWPQGRPCTNTQIGPPGRADQGLRAQTQIGQRRDLVGRKDRLDAQPERFRGQALAGPLPSSRRRLTSSARILRSLLPICWHLNCSTVSEERWCVNRLGDVFGSLRLNCLHANRDGLGGADRLVRGCDVGVSPNTARRPCRLEGFRHCGSCGGRSRSRRATSSAAVPFVPGDAAMRGDRSRVTFALCAGWGGLEAGRRSSAVARLEWHPWSALRSRRRPVSRTRLLAFAERGDDGADRAAGCLRPSRNRRWHCE